MKCHHVILCVESIASSAFTIMPLCYIIKWKRNNSGISLNAVNSEDLVAFEKMLLNNL